MRRRPLLAAMLAALLTPPLAPAAFAAGAATEPARPRVTDARGRVVELAAPARRIVSLAPHVTELLFAAGAGDRVVGAIAYSDHPAAARAIPRVGDTHALDVERIVSLAPDLVVAWDQGTAPGQLDGIERLGIPVYFDGARRLPGIADAIERLGRLAGTEALAERSARQFRQRLARLQQRFAGRTPIRVFYQVWDAPLMTVNGRQLISDVITLCGGVNIFAAEPTLVPRISREAVVRADPDVIVAAGRPDGSDPLAAWARWPGMRAVARGRLVVLPGDLISRLSPRVLDGAERLCEALDSARTRR